MSIEVPPPNPGDAVRLKAWKRQRRSNAWSGFFGFVSVMVTVLSVGVVAGVFLLQSLPCKPTVITPTAFDETEQRADALDVVRIRIDDTAPATEGGPFPIGTAVQLVDVTVLESLRGVWVSGNRLTLDLPREPSGPIGRVDCPASDPLPAVAPVWSAGTELIVYVEPTEAERTQRDDGDEITAPTAGVRRTELIANGDGLARWTAWWPDVLDRQVVPTPVIHRMVTWAG